MLWGLCGNVPGETQTVARGELYAIVHAATLALEGAVVDFVTDNLGNCNKFNAGREEAVLTNNGDLFTVLFDEIRIKDLVFTVRWMPSHTIPGDDLPPGVSALDVAGNDFADKQAEVAAKQFVVSLNMSTHVLWFLNLASRIQRRLVHIMCSLEARKRSDIVKPDKILLKQQEIEALFPFS